MLREWWAKAISALTSLVQPSGGSTSSFWSLLNRSHINYAAEVKPDQSTLVIACVRWVQRTFTEAPPIIEQWAADRQEWAQVQRSPILDLLDRPNNFYNGVSLWKATIADLMLTGNAYWAKIRSGSGRVAALLWLPSWTLEPVGDLNDPTVFISHYEYRPNPTNPTQVTLIREADVVHFRDGMDPQNVRKGLSPIKSLFREIFTDDEAANMTASLLRNMGVPGVIIAPKQGTVNKEAALALKAAYMDNFSGDRKGEPLVLNGDATVTQFGFSPEQMQLRALRGIPEERITAVLGVNSAVIGLGAGLETTKVGAPQPLSATLWTPTGPITMGDVEEGQLIASPHGWVPVRAIYPQGEQDIYRITFQDGSTAESTADHLWQVGLPNKRQHPDDVVLPLSAIAKFPYDKLKRTTVPLQGVTEFEEQPTLIPPYVFGLLLGDGTFRHQLAISNISEEIIDNLKAELPEGYSLRHKGRGDYLIAYDAHALGRGVGNGSGNLHPMKDELRRLGLWMAYSNEKFIPDLYKYNSSHVRREVLRGLLDTDGFVNLHGQPAVEQTSKRLAEDVTWLVQSLGGYTLTHLKRVNTATRLISGRPMASRYDRYSQSIVIEDAASLFRYSYKRLRCRPRGKVPTRKFRSIEWVRREEAQCISVDGGLYLTDNFIVTHNTLREYREEVVESLICPLYREMGSELTHQLLADFESGSDVRLTFDLSRVRVLQDDENKRIERLLKELNGGGITLAEYRRARGAVAKPSDEVYYRPTSVTAVPATAPLTAAPANGNGNGLGAPKDALDALYLLAGKD